MLLSGFMFIGMPEMHTEKSHAIREEEMRKSTMAAITI